MSGHASTSAKGFTTQPWDPWLIMLGAWHNLMMLLAAVRLAPDRLYQPIDASVIGGGNFSLLSATITQQHTDEPALEHAIVTDVASYGRQLGRILDALTVLIDQVPRQQLDADQDAALNRLTEMADQIRQAQTSYTEQHLDDLLDNIRRLGQPPVDHPALERIRTLVAQLDDDGGPMSCVACGEAPN